MTKDELDKIKSRITLLKQRIKWDKEELSQLDENKLALDKQFYDENFQKLNKEEKQ